MSFIFAQMKRNSLIIICILVFLFGISLQTIAQDTLPQFTLRFLGKGKAQISWTNPFESCVQLSVQRSYDSLKFFRTIYSAQSPNLPQNGFVDNNTVSGMKVFYRIFYVIEGGNYFFTKSKSQSVSSVQPEDEAIGLTNKRRINTDIVSIIGREIKPGNPLNAVKPIEKKFISIFNRNKDSLLEILEFPDFKRFRDSISSKTKDTLFALNADEILLKTFIPKYVWKPSLYIFTNDNGYVTIALPGTKQHRYRIIFFEENGTEIFQIKQVKEEELILDKTNFLHEGWFHFELFEDEKLKEKNKIFLEKDF